MFVQLVLLAIVGISFVHAAAPPFGQLSVKGTNLVGSNGKPVQLIGNSLFWHQWYPQFWNAQTVKALKCNWNSNVVRTAMGVEQGGYLSDANTAYRLTAAVIEAAIAQGIYVIVDWHAHEPNADKAIEFFTKIAKAYGSNANLLYETFNEPLDVSWNNVLVPYHKKVISAIRAIDKKNVIILGTPKWSQDVDVAAQNPIKGFSNLMYTLHFYASSHFVDGLGNKLKTAVNKGLPVFVTEYGTCEASGNGNLNSGSMSSWWSLLDQLKISYVNWAIADKSEACAALTGGTSAANVGTSSRWTQSGNMVASQHKKKSTGVNCNGGGGAAAKPAAKPAAKSKGKSSKAKKSG